jgi:prepilin-type N-terminal cleavage/methylation domain-containing protein
MSVMKAGTRKAGPGACSGRSGFTLPEVMIAAGILAAGLTAIVWLSGTILRMNEQCIQTTQASLYATDAMERLIGTNYLLAAGGSLNPLPYKVAWSVTEDTAMKFKTVQIEVTWKDLRNNSHRVAARNILGPP